MLILLQANEVQLLQKMIDIVNMVSSVFELAGADLSYGDGYPGWKPDVHSEILGVMKSTFKNLFNKEPEVKAIHAGLRMRNNR